MAFWDNLNEKAKTTSDKANEKIEIARINGKIKTEQLTIEGLKAELGARYWQKISAGAVEPDPELADTVGKLRAAFEKIGSLEADIKKIEDARRAADEEAVRRAEEAARKAAEEAARHAEETARKAAAAQQFTASSAASSAAAAAAAVQQSAPVTNPTGSVGHPQQGEYNFNAPVQQTPPAQPSAGLKCAACGTELTPGARFCPECGKPAPAPAPAPAEPAKHFCANCGTELAPGARFCPECGTRA